MYNETLLMMPGPVPMPESVRNAMTKQAINHRSKEFGACYADIVRILKPVFGTTNDLLVLSGSGTAGQEAAIGSFAKGKKVAALVNGKFGERLGQIADIYGEAVMIESEWGHPLNLEGLKEALENGAEVVTLVHNETSAAILNPAEEVGKLARKHDALFILDAITSIGGDVVEADKWGADVAIVGSQKCLAAPAGLAAVSVSQRAWDRLSEKRPLYLDLKKAKKSADGNPMETPTTPAVPLFLALREACKLIEAEGLENRIARHHKMSAAVRAAGSAWGLSLVPQVDALHQPSNTVTGFFYPAGVDDSQIRGACKKMGIEFAGGQDRMKGKIFRIGNMGIIDTPEILATVAAVQMSFKKAGYKLEGDGLAAAVEVLSA
ncbi:Serine-pyruvate aminotransferase [Methanocorpusculaceae archaeon Sp1]|uniref:Serine-pyruvate aminotransferase n=1 Tax=Methanorbis furvi TaxID=3028299 RepID=A0AAE4MB47_9EURY|nr:Serine-pyruvate aminotransferase [Methanocorpusculaceae archaeon Sp1]MDV0440895.1 Serine-pyruvate aminotransferase [Methanocorpusculaceae archaeon Ag1]